MKTLNSKKFPTLTKILATEHEPDEEDAFLTPTGSLGSKTSLSVGGKHIGDFADDEAAEKALKEWMKKNNFYPNVWYVSDHGNVAPYKMEGNISDLSDTPPGKGPLCVICDEPANDTIFNEAYETEEFVCSNPDCKEKFLRESGMPNVNERPHPGDLG